MNSFFPVISLKHVHVHVLFVYICVCVHTCRYIYICAYVVSMCAYAHVCVYVCLHVHVSIDLLLWWDIPFPSEVDFEEWLIVWGGLKRVHSLVQSLSTVGQNSWHFPPPEKELVTSSLRQRAAFMWKAEMKAGRSQQTKDSWRTNAVTVERAHREKEKVAFDSERGNRWLCRSGVPAV